MITQFPLQEFFQFCQNSWHSLSDYRKPNPNTRYAVSDAVNSAMSVFFMQSSSFLAHHQTITHKKKGKQNLQTLFQVEKVPSDNQIRNLIDPVSPLEFSLQYQWIWEKMSEYRVQKAYKTSLGTVSVALDGMVYHSSKKISCDACTSRKDAAGNLHYYHATLLPLLVHPDQNQVLPFFPEMITPQDGTEKQDCERVATKRWLTRWKTLFEPQAVTYLGDDLFCNQPICEQIIAQNQFFIFVCKPDSHKTLYTWVHTLTPFSHTERKWNGKSGEIWRWQWINNIPIRGGDDALYVNWCDLEIINETDGTTIYHNSWATNHTITSENVADICRIGRTRWKIENEGINILKTKGYHVEHNFGHGKQYLSQNLLILNLLAFLLHTALQIIDDLYIFLRKSLHKRTIFFDDLRALCRYHHFPDWVTLWLFMIESLDDDAIPPQIQRLISD